MKGPVEVSIAAYSWLPSREALEASVDPTW
jgi:hypothetical protein